MLGWIKIYDYKGATLPITVDQRVYSPAQLSIAQLSANWMQASYLPTSALGDVFQIRNEKLSPYNQNTAALPQSYGAFARLYTTLKYGVNKKPVPMTSDGLVWTLEANGFYGIPADDISTPEHYYFTLPTFVTFKLFRPPAAGKGESFLSLRIRPGFSGREGEVVIEGQFPGTRGYLDGSKWVGAPGFSNDAVNNRVTVTLEKKGEPLQVFIGKTKVAEYEKGIPSDLQFDSMSFELTGTSANDKMFIGNIRIATN